jgi:hypothetical protein
MGESGDLSEAGDRRSVIRLLFPPLERREWLWIALGSLIYAAIFCYPLLCDFVYLGPGLSRWIWTGPQWSHLGRLPANGDADLFTHIGWAGWYTVAHFHQLPFWNPWKCGGMPELGNPETAILTPFFLASLLIGYTPGLYLSIYLHLAIAAAGGYVLGRVLGLGVLASAVAAAVFPSSSWYYLHLAMGHLNFLPAVYLPWIAALLIVAFQTDRYFVAAIAGLIAALTFTEGNYTLLFVMVLTGVLAISYSVLNLSVRPLLMAIVIGAFAAGFAALKFLPASQALSLRPRHGFGPEWDTIRMVLGYAFSRDQDLYKPGASVFIYSEYGAYVAWAFVPLAAIGICARPLKSLPWIAAAVLFFWLAGGDTQPYAALRGLRMLPLAGNIAFPCRFIIAFPLCVGVIAALGAQFLITRTTGWGVAAVAVLLVAGLADAWTVGPPNLRYMFHNPVMPAPSQSTQFRQIDLHNPAENATATAWSNQGVVNCYGYWYPPGPDGVKAYGEKGYRGEYYTIGPGRVAQLEWSPNRLVYEVDAAAPTTLIVNQNYYPGWRVSQGTAKLRTDAEMLEVELPAGRHRVTLAYRPRLLWLALALTLAATFGTVLLWRMEAKR